eukprot:gene31188-40548_t
MSYTMLSAPIKANNSNGDDLPKLTTAATIASSATVSIIASNIEEYGVTKGGAKMMKYEALAAQESIASGIYIVWVPHPSCKLTGAASDDIKNGSSQCCRVGSDSICLQCSHPLKSHAAIKVPSRGGGYIRPPSCSGRCRCKGFSYCPIRPEECGQWWLPRRRDFDVDEWIA